jgi:hypothetical protein
LAAIAVFSVGVVSAREPFGLDRYELDQYAGKKSAPLSFLRLNKDREDGGALAELQQIVRADSSSECVDKSWIFVERERLVLLRCVHSCFGMLQSAAVKDLAFPAARVVPHERVADRAFVTIPCRRSKCVKVAYGMMYGGGGPCALQIGHGKEDVASEIELGIKKTDSSRALALAKKIPAR